MRLQRVCRSSSAMASQKVMSDLSQVQEGQAPSSPACASRGLHSRQHFAHIVLRT